MESLQLPPTVWPRVHAMYPGKTFVKFMSAYRNPKAGLPALQSALELNPGFVHLVQGFDLFKKMREKWDDQPTVVGPAQAAPAPANPATPAAPGAAAAPAATGPVARMTAAPAKDFLSSVGKIQARNAVASLAMMRSAQGPLPRNAADDFTFTPATKLKYALLSEDFHESRRLGHSEEAFLAGLHYDWFFELAMADKAPAEVQLELETAWKEGFRAAQVARRIASNYKNLPLSEWIFAATMSIYLGRAWSAWIYSVNHPGCAFWKDFRSKVDAVTTKKREAWRFIERRMFPLVHTDFAALSASSFGFLGDVAPVIAASQDPIVLRKVSPAHYQIALIVRAGQIISSIPTDDIVDPRSGLFSRLDKWVIKELKLSDSIIGPLLKKLEEPPS